MVNVFRLRNASLLLMSYSSRDSGAFSTVWHHLPWKFSWLNGSWMEAARYDWRGRDYRLLCELSWGGWWGTRKMEGSQHQGHQRCSIQGKQAYLSAVWHILGMVTCLRVHTQDLLKDLCHFSGVHWQHWHGEIRSVWLAKQDIHFLIHICKHYNSGSYAQEEEHVSGSGGGVGLHCSAYHRCLRLFMLDQLFSILRTSSARSSCQVPTLIDICTESRTRSGQARKYPMLKSVPHYFYLTFEIYDISNTN